MAFGVSLIIAGVAFLLHNLGILPYSPWGYIWPALLILWGLSVMRGGGRRLCFCCPAYVEEREEEAAKGS